MNEMQFKQLIVDFLKNFYQNQGMGLDENAIKFVFQFDLLENKKAIVVVDNDPTMRFEFVYDDNKKLLHCNSYKLWQKASYRVQFEEQPQQPEIPQESELMEKLQEQAEAVKQEQKKSNKKGN